MPIRETFWNIPQWAEIGQYVLGLLTVLVFAYGVFRRVQRWRIGQPEPRTDRLGARLPGGQGARCAAEGHRRIGVKRRHDLAGVGQGGVGRAAAAAAGEERQGEKPPHERRV